MGDLAGVRAWLVGGAGAASALSLAWACGGTPGYGNGTNDYAGALVTAGAGVFAAGGNRALTGDCWARCRNGMMCDRDSGMCVDVPCGGTCPADWKCQRIGGREQCVQPTLAHKEIDLCPVPDASSILLRMPCADAGPD